MNWQRPASKHPLNFGKSHLASYKKGVLSKPQFAYWAVRGRGQGIRYQLQYLGADVEEIIYKVPEKEKWFGDDKMNLGLHFANLPYFIDTDGYCLTESFAVYEYISLKYAPMLLGTTP